MLSDGVRASIAELLQVFAKAEVTAGLCNRRGEVEVCVGDVTPYLEGLEWAGSYLTDGTPSVWVDEISPEFRLVCRIETEDQLGFVVGASHSIRPALEAILSGDQPDPPARSAANKVGAA